MRLYEKYLGKTVFTSYEDFKENFELKVPENFNFAYDVLDELANTKPNKTGILWTNLEGNRQEYTFADIKKQSDKVANFFVSQGIKKGDKVMLILKRHIEFWFCIMALHKIGAVTIPATHLLKKKDIVYRNNAAGVKMIVCTNEGNVKDAVDEAKGESKLLETCVILNEKRDGWIDFGEGVYPQSEVFKRPIGEDAPKNNDILLLYFTSGTTGMPKMVAQKYDYPLGHIVTAVYWHNCDPDGIHFTVSDTGWAKSVWGKLYGQWLAETTVFVYAFDVFEPKKMLKVMEENKITTFCAPPTIYRYFIKEDLKSYDLSSLKYATTAGEPLNPEVFNQFKAGTGLCLKECFGQTETTLSVGTFTFMKPKPGSMGRPNPMYDMDIVDENGESQVPGESGEIIIHTKNGAPPTGLFLGYYMDDDRTNEVWQNGIYRTGDVAWKDEAGYYWYVGRADDVIKSSGYRIGPFEVESALMEHPAVLETAITGVPHPERGTIIKATIVLAKGFEGSDKLVKELQDHVKSTTAPYKYPRVIEFVKELPKTVSGKIRRVELREKDGQK